MNSALLMGLETLFLKSKHIFFIGIKLKKNLDGHKHCTLNACHIKIHTTTITNKANISITWDF